MQELQQRIKRANESEPSSEGEYEEQMAKIRKDMVDFHGEMVLLVNYSNINYTGKSRNKKSTILIILLSNQNLGQRFFFFFLHFYLAKY